MCRFISLKTIFMEKDNVSKRIKLYTIPHIDNVSLKIRLRIAELDVKSLFLGIRILKEKSMIV